MKKHAVYTGTKNIYPDMEIAAKSLVANSNVDAVHFLIEDDEFPSDIPQIIQCHNVSGQQFFKSGTPNMKSHFSYMAMMRIALCHIFEDLDVILSLDCDTIVVQDISSIWQLPINECYFSASPEWHRSVNGLVYCNHGVVLYNLAKLRDGKADECIYVLNNNKYTFVEQDVANYLCQGRIHPMPAQYNVNYWTCRKGQTVDPYITHFAGIPRDQWIEDSIALKWKNTPWDIVMSMHTGKVMEHQLS